jgi:hypothetical protein
MYKKRLDSRQAPLDRHASPGSITIFGRPGRSFEPFWAVFGQQVGWPGHGPNLGKDTSQAASTAAVWVVNRKICAIKDLERIAREGVGVWGRKVLWRVHVPGLREMRRICLRNPDISLLELFGV